MNNQNVIETLKQEKERYFQVKCPSNYIKDCDCAVKCNRHKCWTNKFIELIDELK